MALQLLRTANAGVLLTMDGVTLLLDGVCREIAPYMATPPQLRDALKEQMPDILAFTHCHQDHYDHAFATAYQEKTLRPVFGPESLPCGGKMESAVVKNVRITPFPSRHIGKVQEEHTSFILQGAQCVWFVGDASPAQWLRKPEFPKPDVLITPYACALSPSVWKAACGLAKTVVLLHLPLRGNDPAGLWPVVDAVVGDTSNVYIPEIGESLLDL